MSGTQLPTSRGGRILVWLFFATFVAIGFGWFGGGSQLSDAARLRSSGVHAPGIVTSISAGDALNNPTAYYTFVAGGSRVYGHAHIRSQDEHRLTKGSPITVTYLPQNPSDSCLDPEGLGDAGRRAVLIAAAMELVLAAIFIPLVALSGPAAPARIQLKGENLSAAMVLTILALVGLGGLFFSAIPGYERAEELVSRGETAQAVITGVYDHSKSNGRYANYTYAVDGAYYHGKSDYVGGYGDKGPITITYLPSEPSFSAIQPQATLAGARWIVLFLIGWLVLVAGFGVACVYGSHQLRSYKQ